MRLKLSFQIKLFLCLVAFSCLLLTCIGAYTYYQLDAQLHRDLGARARCRRGKSPSFLRWWTQWRTTTPPDRRADEKIRASSDASYIVIGDSHARHLYHSEYEGRLGTPMIGGDNKEVLEGKALFPFARAALAFHCAARRRSWMKIIA